MARFDLQERNPPNPEPYVHVQFSITDTAQNGSEISLLTESKQNTDCLWKIILFVKVETGLCDIPVWM